MVTNWKMKPATLAEAKKIFKMPLKAVARHKKVELVVCPPLAYYADLKKLYSGRKLQFGAQNCHSERAASKTGETSPSMLSSIGINHVIVGHSERRAMGETNEEVNKKLHTAIAEGMTVIVCIGETARDAQGEYVAFLSQQLKSAFKNVTKTMLKQIVVAYEPVWAIGKTAKESTVRPEHVHEMVIFVRKFLTRQYDQSAAESVRVLYGGSTEAANAEMFLWDGHADGLLLGHASLVPKEYEAIVAIADTPPAAR